MVRLRTLNPWEARFVTDMFETEVLHVYDAADSNRSDLSKLDAEPTRRKERIATNRMKRSQKFMVTQPSLV